MHVKIMSMKVRYVFYYLGWLDMCTTMGPSLSTAHVCLDRIGPNFCFYVHEYECMVMCGSNVLCERFPHIYVYKHT